MNDKFGTFDLFISDLNDKADANTYRSIPVKNYIRRAEKAPVPERIRQMKELAFTSEAYWKTSPWLFRQQGLFMADYTDDQPFGEDFPAYYPTYRDLSTEQLRGYFSWRTAVRRGELPDAPQPFILMYAYELINLIGAGSPEEAFGKLKYLFSRYSEGCQELQRGAEKWLCDFAAYYQLPKELLGDTPDMIYDRAVLTLRDWDEQDDDSLFFAISRLSAYQPEHSAMFEESPELFRNAVCRAYSALAEHFRLKRKNPLAEKLFGKTVEIRHRLFEGAVFFDTDPRRSLDYEIDPIHSIICRSGDWFCRKLYGNRGRNKLLGEIVRTVDSSLREITGRQHKIAAGELSAFSAKLIAKAVQNTVNEQKRTEQRHITIDLSMLGAIRSAADITRERLIVDEEEEEALSPAPATPPVIEKPADNSLLNAAETAFLRTLLCGGDYAGTAGKYGVLPSIAADSINEKLFDIFSDNVIEFSGDVPCIIEDYSDELNEKFGIQTDQ
ncbi:MAG: TerB N-terminal domain-containing protein [Ruminococcus sp.]|nr:TerB N-terminal domain-containing protein [Ruminococcus sp.]